MIETITPEAYNLKNLDDLSKEIFEKSPNISQPTKQVIGQVIVEKSGETDSADEVRARLAFMKCFTDNYDTNSQRLVNSLVGSPSESYFRDLLKEYSEIMDLNPEDQKALIADHFDDILKKARAINESLADL